jgi:hypothetical protein
MTTIWLNDLVIEVERMNEKKMENGGEILHQLEMEFKVTHETYHDVTTELYKNDFFVRVPEKDLEFQAEIQNYFTSVTNLYEKNTVGDFTLVLKQKS